MASDQAFTAPLALIVRGQVVEGGVEQVATVASPPCSLHGGMLAAADLDEIVPATVERLLLGLRPRA